RGKSLPRQVFALPAPRRSASRFLPEFRKTLSAQAARRAIAAAVTPSVAAAAITEVAGMSFLKNQIKQGLPPDLLSHTKSGGLIDPHQRRMHSKIALHAEIESSRHGLD